jgi:hypothetical protein
VRRRRSAEARTSGGSGCLSSDWRGLLCLCCRRCFVDVLFCFVVLSFLFWGCRRRVAIGGVGDGETGSVSLYKGNLNKLSVLLYSIRFRLWQIERSSLAT